MYSYQGLRSELKSYALSREFKLEYNSHFNDTAFQFVLSATFEQLQLHSLPQNPSATATFKQAGVAVAVEVALSKDVKNQPESRATTATEDVLKTTQLQQIGLDETWNQERT